MIEQNNVYVATSEGQNLEIPCHISGPDGRTPSPRPDIIWTAYQYSENGPVIRIERIENGSHGQTISVDNKTLYINSINSSDFTTEFECAVNNSIGRATQVTILLHREDLDLCVRPMGVMNNTETIEVSS